MRNICKKHLCWSLFPIKKFKATLLQRDFNTGVFVLKNICKRVLLWGVISTRSGFCTSCPFKILVSERNYKNNLKLWISKNNLYDSHVMFICFTTKSRDFTKIFKSENLFLKSVLSSRSENTGPVTKDHNKYSEMRKERSLQL